jgi:hypothetical protein
MNVTLIVIGPDIRPVRPEIARIRFPMPGRIAVGPQYDPPVLLAAAG